MARVTARLLHTAAIVLSTTTVAKAGLWDVDIDLDPAPPPEDGPPFSAHASRNRELLPYQIIGVVGAYLGFMLILGSLLLTVGRKFRKRARQVAASPLEMVKPILTNLGHSPNPPSLRAGSIHSFWGKPKSIISVNGSKAMSPGGQSVSSIDLSVVERDRQKQREQMAQLYGHLWEYEDQKMQQGMTSPNFSRPDLRPLDLRRLPSSGSTQYSGPASPRSPVHAIYPPQNMDARSPVSMRYQPYPLSEREEGPYHSSDDITAPRAPPSSKKHRRRFSKLNISSPLASRFGDDNSDGARTPLSPRFYINPGTPPAPPSALAVNSGGHNRTASSSTTTTQHSRREHDKKHDTLETIRPLPTPRPQRPLPTQRGNMSQIHTSQNTLPLREYQNQHLASPTPSSTKTTILESKPRNFPLTAGATPYSAYFPGRMLQPVTPRIVTRAERLQREKEERAVKGALAEEDQVAEEGEMWEDAY